ncbi:MAG: elongation factor 1-beta [Candidatus Aenigmatarchaeota archaeon]
MAKVLLTLKILPSDISINIKQIKENIEKKLNFVSMKEEPIAFGLVSLIASVLIEDKEGEAEKIEKMIKEVDGVGEVEVIEVTRTL